MQFSLHTNTHQCMYYIHVYILYSTYIIIVLVHELRLHDCFLYQLHEFVVLVVIPNSSSQ